MRAPLRLLGPAAWTTLALGLAGFTLHLSGHVSSTVGDDTTCRQADVGPFSAAGVTLAGVVWCAVVAWRAEGARRVAHAAVGAVGLLLVVLHVLDGVASIGAPCPADPFGDGF